MVRQESGYKVNLGIFDFVDDISWINDIDFTCFCVNIIMNA